MSHAFFISFGSGRPRLRRSSVRLLVCHAELTAVANTTPLDRVATLARDDVDAQAAKRLLGGHGRVIDGHFLRGAGVGHEVRELPSRQDVAEPDAIELKARVAGPSAMNRKRRVLEVVRATDVGERAAPGLGRRQARDQHHHVDVAAAGRDRLDHLLIEHALLRRALNVDDRAVTGDGDRLLERTDAQVDVDRGDEGARQLDSFAPHRRESAQREGHDIRCPAADR